jgi:hypothetical protein
LASDKERTGNENYRPRQRRPAAVILRVRFYIVPLDKLLHYCFVPSLCRPRQRRSHVDGWGYALQTPSFERRMVRTVSWPAGIPEIVRIKTGSRTTSKLVPARGSPPSRHPGSDHQALKVVLNSRVDLLY